MEESKLIRQIEYIKNCPHYSIFAIDLFCGAGGETTGIELAKVNGVKCAKVIAAVNHDMNAIASHAANHPNVLHYIEDIRTLNLDGLEMLADTVRKYHPKSMLMLHASLECTNFSRAKGGMPRDADSRTLAEHLFRYVEVINPDCIQIENVEEFMSWGELDENGKPISTHRGSDYLKWIKAMEAYGYKYECRILNAADYGAYTSRKRLFGQFVKNAMRHAFPEADYARKCEYNNGMFGISLKPWKPVRDVLDLDDEGESIFTRRKPLVEATLRMIYAGLVKFVAGGERNFLVRYNQVRPQDTVLSLEKPCGVVTTENRFAVVRSEFLSKQFSGDDRSKNISCDQPAGSVTTKDHHALITYYRHGGVTSVEEPSPTITTRDRVAKVTFIANEYSGGGQIGSIDNVAPAILTTPKQKLVNCFLVNPQYASKGGSVDSPCFTLIARMDKMPPYLITTNRGVGIEIYDKDSEMTVKIKQFMAAYGIIDIKMRMLKVDELKRIMGFPEGYKLKGTLSEQKKYIGNAVEVNMSRRLCEAMAASI